METLRILWKRCIIEWHRESNVVSLGFCFVLICFLYDFASLCQDLIPFLKFYFFSRISGFSKQYHRQSVIHIAQSSASYGEQQAQGRVVVY